MKIFEEFKEAKLLEFDEMLKYISTENCRMKFLCDFLGDSRTENCGKCDNDLNKTVSVTVTDEWTKKLDDFRQTYFPVLELETQTGILINGAAASYYGVSNVGKAIHRCKYERGGDFPDWLITLTLKCFYRSYSGIRFDVILYVPPTVSGNLVLNFAKRISDALKIPLSHSLTKTRRTEPQKVFNSSITKKDNLKDAFQIENINEIKGKNVLIIDDIYDSGNTMKAIGKVLKKAGANLAAPLVIAKTVGGDIL